MLTCAICGEELMLEEDMKTHLLLSHLENEMSCPLCSLSGVSYDELKFHMDTAHPEKHDGDTAQAHSTHGCHSPTGANRKPKHHVRDLSRHSERETAPSSSSGDTCYTTKGGGVSPETSLHGTIAQQRRDVAGTSPVVGEGLLTARTAPATPPAETTTRTRTSQGSEQESCGGEGTATSEINREQPKAKQKRLSTPIKEKQFPCPMCSQVYNNCFTLQEHVELHLQEQSIAEGAALGTSSSASMPPSAHNFSGKKSYECPMCSLVCSDSSSLQEHVDLHLEYGAATTCAVSPSSDLKLAKQLQEAEDQRRREHEAKQEAVEFKKLQKQFGLDGSGGYRRQMEQTMEKAVSRGLMAPADFHISRANMMEALATGLDDGRTRTQGMLGALSEFYQREARDCVHVWLSAETDHFCSSEGDKGWGCGYRNFQMLLSSIHRIDTFAACLPEKAVPSIPQVQHLIEEAWRMGLDPQGASHFNQRLQGTRAWIGATEIYAVLTSLGVRATIIDFHQPTGPADTHPRLFEWVKQYFSMSSSRGTRLPPRLIQTSQPPLYLQHQGHSRTIVGVEQKRNGGLCLLVLDPGCSPAEARKLLSRDSAATAVRRIRKFPNNLKHKQYQVVAAKGTLSPEEKQICILNSRTLRAERIP